MEFRNSQRNGRIQIRTFHGRGMDIFCNTAVLRKIVSRARNKPSQSGIFINHSKLIKANFFVHCVPENIHTFTVDRHNGGV